MKKLTSNIIRILYIVTSIFVIPVSCIEIYEIISGSAVVDPHLRNLTDGIFWSVLAVNYLCSWYISKHKNMIEA